MGNPSIRPLGGWTVTLEGQEMVRKLSLLFAGALMGASAMAQPEATVELRLSDESMDDLSPEPA